MLTDQAAQSKPPNTTQNDTKVAHSHGTLPLPKQCIINSM